MIAKPRTGRKSKASAQRPPRRDLSKVLGCNQKQREIKYQQSLQERLAFYESLYLGQLSETELIDVAGEASSLHKFLIDIMEEGYTAAVNQLIAQTDAMNRLQRFLSTVLHVLGPPSERERFYLYPDIDAFGTDHAGGV